MSVLLAETYSPDIDPTGWHITEKLDGIRAVWDGVNLVSRNGNIFPAPDWFKALLPKDSKLDGELYLGRKLFEKTSSIIRSGSSDKGWNKIVYMSFDIPDPKAGPVESRWVKLDTIVKDCNSKHLQTLQRIKCEGASQLYQLLDAVVALGGEGLMLRKPGSRYETKRSDTLLKVKKFFDAEATVTGYTELLSAGQVVKGAVGALECVTPKGLQFKVGTGFTESQRRNMPPIGSTITYKYQELTKNGTPRFPVYVGVRDYE